MKYKFVVLLLVLATSYSLQAKKNEPITENADSLAVQSDTLVSLATSLLGVPYRYGGITPEQGFDCSGFVKYVFSNFGFDIPRTTIEIANYGEEIHVDSCKKGDIILFSGRNKEKRPIGHDGIIISDVNEPLEFIHSATSNNRGIVITAYDALDYYKNRFVKVIRVLGL
ncbi:MAG TPA: NlpC/P60 family protein [Flavobacteriales bacterium]|nr:NlpC/P60 family protein [Flavobacteriales bacterium]